MLGSSCRPSWMFEFPKTEAESIPGSPASCRTSDPQCGPAERNDLNSELFVRPMGGFVCLLS